jgi:recombinational DNA repair protein (RecF pathway)
MSTIAHLLEGIALSRVEAGENHLRISVFSETQGLQTVLFGKGRKNQANDLPDLFDELELSLAPARSTGFRFVREYRVIAKRRALAHDHKRFQVASDLASLFLENGQHLLEPKPFADLLHSALSALCKGGNPQVVYFKSLFVFARSEGLPVKEAWLSDLSKGDQVRARSILSLTVDAQDDGGSSLCMLIDSLRSWLNAETELRC